MAAKMRFNFKSKTFWLPILAAFVAGAILGGGITRTIDFSQYLNNNDGLPTTGTGGGAGSSVPAISVADLQLTLNNLLTEHAVLTSQYLQEVYDSKDTTTSEQLLNANTQNITNVFDIIYGNNAATGFTKLWQDQLSQYKNYTVALKNNDQNGMTQSKAALDNGASSLGQAVNQIDPNIPKGSVTQMMTDRTSLTLDYITAHANKNETGVASGFKQSFDQAGQMADALTQAIVYSKPNMFQ